MCEGRRDRLERKRIHRQRLRGEVLAHVLDDERIVVPKQIDADAADEVESLVSFRVPDIATLGAFDVEGQSTGEAEFRAVLVHMLELHVLDLVLGQIEGLVEADESRIQFGCGSHGQILPFLVCERVLTLKHRDFPDDFTYVSSNDHRCRFCYLSARSLIYRMRRLQLSAAARWRARGRAPRAPDGRHRP